MMIPQIKSDRGIPTLYVKGEPFFALAGELHNSSSSSLEYMERQVWPNLQGMNLNTVLLPISWETIEPREGEYDFTLVDGLIRQAREAQMHLVFLWFGLWKNGESMYVPQWMKEDGRKYFRARKVNGEPLNTISPLCQAAVEKDAEAFSRVMAHIREMDQEESTVIFIQVENEIGLLGTARDYSSEANEAFCLRNTAGQEPGGRYLGSRRRKPLWHMRMQQQWRRLPEPGKRNIRCPAMPMHGSVNIHGILAPIPAGDRWRGCIGSGNVRHPPCSPWLLISMCPMWPR